MSPHAGISLQCNVIQHFMDNKRLKLLYLYSLSVYVTAGRGYQREDIFIEEIRDLANCHKKTAKRYVSQLHEANLINKKRGDIVLKGRSKLVEDLGRMKIRIPKEKMCSYKAFMTHIFEQQALIVQSRFRYSHARKKFSDTASSTSDEGIETTDLKYLSTKRIGAALSKISEYNNQAKSTTHRYLRNSLKTQKALLFSMPYKEFKRKFSKDFFKSNPLYCFIYNKVNKKVYFYQKIASTYDVSKMYMR